MVDGAVDSFGRLWLKHMIDPLAPEPARELAYVHSEDAIKATSGKLSPLHSSH